MGIAEANLTKVNDLFKNKREIRWALRMLDTETELQLSIYNQPIIVRTQQLRDMLKIELKYTNRMLKSYGVTELSGDSHD